MRLCPNQCLVVQCNGLRLMNILMDQVATFPNKAAYDEMTNLRNNHRKEATDSGIKMIYEVIGHLKAEGKS